MPAPATTTYRSTYDRIAIVTGADSGIGQATAVRLAYDGFDVGLTYASDEAGAAQTASEVEAAGRRCAVRQHGGRIVNVTSVHEHAPRVGAAPYCAAKAGLGLLGQVMAIELAEHGITVNAVAPGEIATPMTGQDDADVTAAERPGVPLRRPGDAREVAAVIAFLAGPDASYVTGASWPVDGGMLTMGPHAGSHLTDDAWRQG